MGFASEDKTEQKEVTTRATQVRIERAAPVVIEGAILDEEGEEITPAVYGPHPTVPVNVYVVMEVDGHAEHLRVSDEIVEANWDGPEKTLKAWVLAMVNVVA